MILKPIEGEEWIEKFRRREFWIAMRRRYPQKFYSRLTRSYLGWRLYFRVHGIWHRAGLLVDPLSSGGLYAHIHSFLYNWIVVDVVWRTKHRIWRILHRKQWEKQCAFFAACSQASAEGCADPIPGPAWLPAENFHGFMLGERYFKRVAELMGDSSK